MAFDDSQFHAYVDCKSSLSYVIFMLFYWYWLANFLGLMAYQPLLVINTKSLFIQFISSISNYLVYHQYTI